MTEQEFIKAMNSKFVQSSINKLARIYCERLSRADLVQEIILQVWDSLSRFKKSCSFETWVYNIAKFTCINAHRRYKARPILESLDEFNEVIFAERYDEELIKQLEEAIKYKAVINSIDEEFREIFLQYIDGVSFSDLSQQYGISETNLRVKVHRIKKRLRLRYGK